MKSSLKPHLTTEKPNGSRPKLKTLSKVSPKLIWKPIRSLQMGHFRFQWKYYSLLRSKLFETLSELMTISRALDRGFKICWIRRKICFQTLSDFSKNSFWFTGSESTQVPKRFSLAAQKCRILNIFLNEFWSRCPRCSFWWYLFLNPCKHTIVTI